MKSILLSQTSGFLVIGDYVFAFRYSDIGDQLIVTNPDGSSVFQPLNGEDAKSAMQTILAAADTATTTA